MDLESDEVARRVNDDVTLASIDLLARIKPALTATALYFASFAGSPTTPNGAQNRRCAAASDVFCASVESVSFRP